MRQLHAVEHEMSVESACTSIPRIRSWAWISASVMSDLVSTKNRSRP